MYRSLRSKNVLLLIDDADDLLYKQDGFFCRDDFYKIQINRLLKNNEHPIMKPVELVKQAIVNSSKFGNIILDVFCGSDSTLITAETTATLTLVANGLVPAKAGLIRLKRRKLVSYAWKSDCQLWKTNALRKVWIGKKSWSNG